MLRILVLLCMVASAWTDEDVESKIVLTKQGPIRGYKDGDIYIFYSVPYATAPTGSQRFKAPLPPPVFSEIFEAVDKNIICPQFNYFGMIQSHNKNVQENCLIANIYVPQTEEKNLPVLVNVHGGGYFLGFGEFTTPKQLAKSKKAIIINFNYRLGPHGFLCLGTKDAPGNAGMKDQVSLLRWVKDNIASFGGNPDDVTITGCSAGSSSVDLLQLSKMANGLFNKVIPESGASTATFTVQADPIANAKEYAQLLNFNNVDDIYTLEKFYKTASYDFLTSIDLLENSNFSVLFSPCIERDLGEERFLDDSPVNILKSGNYQKRPMLFGFAKMEGLFRIKYFEDWKEKMNTKFADFLPPDLQFESEEVKEKVAAKVKNFYFGDNAMTGDNVLDYIQYFTDIVFAYSTILSVRLQVEGGNEQIYLYEYGFADESSTKIPYLGTHGADHCAQTWAIYDGLNFTHNDESLASEGYKIVKRTLREMWLNFITTSKPVPEGLSLPMWPPTGPNASPYMLLDEISKLKETPMLEKNIKFWDEIYSKHYRHPIPPKTSPDLKTEL